MLGWSRFLRTATFILPVFLIAGWGLAYLLNCLNMLTSPGVPILVKVPTQGGEIRLYAKSFSYEWRTGTLTATAPHMVGPKGSLFKAGRIEATGLKLNRESDGPIGVIASDATLTIRRDGLGTFEFQSYLPKSEGLKTPVPYSVKLDRSKIVFEDPGWFQDASFEKLRLDGIGDEFTAIIDGTFKGLGGLNAKVQVSPEGTIFAEGTARNLDLGPALPSIRKTAEGRRIPELKRISAKRLSFDGPFTLNWDRIHPPEFVTNTKVLGEDVKFDEFAIDRAKFAGLLTDSGARGSLEAKLPGISGSFRGGAMWGKKFVLAGNLNAGAPTWSQVPKWLRGVLPRDVDLNRVRYVGSVAYDRTGWYLQGPASADRAKAYGETLQNVRVDLGLDPKSVLLARFKATWEGQPARGAMRIGLNPVRFEGGLQARNVRLDRLAKRFGADKVSGQAKVALSFSGTAKRPVAQFQATGRAQYSDLLKGPFAVAGKFGDNKLDLQRAIWRTNSGDLYAKGEASSGPSGLNLDVEGNRLALAPFVENASGEGTFHGKLTGTTKSAKLSGQIEAYNVAYDDYKLPFSTADLTADLNSVRLSNLRAVRGPSVLEGNLALNLKNKRLEGELSAKNILPSTIDPTSELLALINVPKLSISGTLDRPLVQGEFDAKNLIFEGRMVDSVTGKVQLNGTKLSVNDVLATAFGGSATATATYDFKTGQGLAEAKFNELQIGDVAAIPAESGDLKGLLNGTGKWRSTKPGDWKGEFAGAVDRLRLNGIEFGSGGIDLRVKDTKVTGYAQIGNVDRYELIDNLILDWKAKTISADITTAKTPLSDLFHAAGPLLKSSNPDLNRILNDTNGELNLSARVSGSLSDPDWQVSVGEIEKLALNGRDGGTLRVKAEKKGSLIDGIDLKWDSTQGVLGASGKVDLNGDLAISGDLSNFRLNLIGAYYEPFARVAGKIGNFSFLAEGPTKSPTLRASLDTATSDAKDEESYFGLIGADGTVTRVPELRIIFDEINLRQSVKTATGYDGGLTAQGRIAYRGVESAATIQVPLIYPFEIPSDANLLAKIQFKKSVKELEGLISGLDPTKSDGALSVDLGIGGPLDDLRFVGDGIRLDAKVLAFAKSPRQFNNVALNLGLNGGKEGKDPFLDLRAQSAQGGNVEGRIALFAPTLRGLRDFFRSDSTDDLYKVNLDGYLQMNSLVLDEALPGEGRAAGTIDGRLAFGGVLRTPEIGGTLLLRGGKLTLPTKEAPPGESTQFAIAPKFNITVNTDDPFNVRSALLNLNLNGFARIGGNLNEPVVNAEMKVDRGSFRLQAADIRLERDGTVRARYAPAPGVTQAASLDVDLVGRTRLFTLAPTGRVQGYNINLTIKGDMLDPKGLFLDATANPPDLDRQRILGLLGQADQIQALSGILSGGGLTQQRLRDAFLGLAAPSLLNPITNKLGNSLGLDSLIVEFGLGASSAVSFTKSLGPDFTLYGRRELTNPLPGVRQLWELELAYRPRRFGRFGIVFGADQDHPIRISFEYGFRF
jgi:hypothetical protein